MSFDWFTFIAQMINFLILLALLRRFLYRPVVEVMAAREARINARLEEIEVREQKAKAMLRDYQESSEELDARRSHVLSEAQQAAEKTKQSLLKEAKDEVKAQQERWQLGLHKEKQDFLQSLRQRASYEIYQSVRSVLTDLASEPLEHHMVRVFTAKLKQLDAEAKERLQKAGERADYQLSCYSSLPLSQASKASLHSELKALFNHDVQLHWQAKPEIICGLELSIYDQKLAWHVASYVNELEEKVSQVIDQQSRAAQVQVSPL